MNAPPLLLGACAMLWGFEADQWVIGGVLALLIESHRVIHTRWEISTDDIRKLATICNVILLLVVAYFLTTTSARATMPKLLQWLPITLLPLLIATQFSTTGKINPAALFMLLKRRADKDGKQPRQIHLGFPFAALLVIGAGGSNERDLVYYAGAALIAGWSLWMIRSRRYSPLLWVVVFVSATGVGLAAHVGLNNFQHWLVDAAVDLLSGSRTDPYKHATDLGHIGTLKMSDEIVMRVLPDKALPVPLLLHRASYNAYLDQTWVARRSPLEAVQPEDNSALWSLSEGTAPLGEVTVITELIDGLGVLALPAGTADMTNPSVIEMKRNRLGTVRVVGDAGLMRYTTQVEVGASLPQVPDDEDLSVPDTEAEVLDEIVDRLGLRNLSPAKAVAVVEAYFDTDYRYSLYQEGSFLKSPLETFLTSTHAGHCEYFATATTLLLRAAGIPARYATGFSAQEYSRLEALYLVRLRHAHSWSRVYVNGAWIDVDTTPPSWFSAEEETASPLEPLMDLLAWVWHRFSMWQLDSERGGQQWVLLLALPVIGYLVWRMRRQRKRTTLDKPATATGRIYNWPGMTTDLFKIEALLEARGLGRKPGETTSSWAGRLASIDGAFADLRLLVDLHYRQRFGSGSLSPANQARLTHLVSVWLAELVTDPSDSSAKKGV